MSVLYNQRTTQYTPIEFWGTALIFTEGKQILSGCKIMCLPIWFLLESVTEYGLLRVPEPV
jgi:hypothetical protein